MVIGFAIITREQFAEMPALSCLRFLLELFLLHSWSPERGTYLSFNYPSWYLSTFMFCLLLSPAIVRFVSRANKKGVAWLFAGLIGFKLLFASILNAIPYLNAMGFQNGHFSEVLQIDSIAYWVIAVFPPSRILDYMLGCLLCKLAISYKETIGKTGNQLILIGSLLLEVAAIILGAYFEELRLFGIAIWPIPSCGLIFALSNEDKLWKWVRVVFSNPLSVFLGNISFAFYLIHVFMLRAVKYGLKLVHIDSRLLCAILAFVAAQAAASAVYFISRTIKKKLAMRKKAP